RRHTRSDRDWSSDVCSSDLSCGESGGAYELTTRDLFAKYDVPVPRYTSYPTVPEWRTMPTTDQWTQSMAAALERTDATLSVYVQIGRASCREGACSSEADGA